MSAVRRIPGTHQWFDGAPRPWEFKRVWHLEPSLADPDSVYAHLRDSDQERLGALSARLLPEHLRTFAHGPTSTEDR